MNELYDGLKVKNNFRFADTFTCEGSFNGAVNSSTPLAITYPSPVAGGPVIDLSQVPGATVAYLYLRRAAFSHNITVATNFSVLTLDFQTLGGALYGLTIYDTRDFGQFYNIDKIINEPLTSQSFIVPQISNVPVAGSLLSTVNAVATGGTVYYQLTFAIAYQLTPQSREDFLETRLAGIEKSLQDLLAVKAEVS